jgi:hypothetical protein
MLCHVALVRTDVSEECTTSIIRATRIGELGITLAITSNKARYAVLRSMLWLIVTANIVPSSAILVALMMEAICSSKTTVLTRATLHNILKDGILQSHHCENLKYYTYFKEIIETLLTSRQLVKKYIQNLVEIANFA